MITGMLISTSSDSNLKFIANGQFVLPLTISDLLPSFCWVDRFVEIYRIRMTQAIRVLLKLYQKQGTYICTP